LSISFASSVTLSIVCVYVFTLSSVSLLCLILIILLLASSSAALIFLNNGEFLISPYISSNIFSISFAHASVFVSSSVKAALFIELVYEGASESGSIYSLFHCSSSVSALLNLSSLVVSFVSSYHVCTLFGSNNFLWALLYGSCSSGSNGFVRNLKSVSLCLSIYVKFIVYWGDLFCPFFAYWMFSW